MTDQVNPEVPEVKPVVPAVVAPVVPEQIGAAPVVAPVVPIVAPEGEIISYEPTGDVGLDMALTFVGKAGINASHPAMQAAQNGDFTILKATLAAKGVQGWEQFVALGEAAYARTSADNDKKATASREAIFKEAGGEENWNAIKLWAGANATPEEKAEVNALLNQGGLAAKGAVKYLSEAYAKANNVEVNPRDPLANAIPNGGSATAGPLSPKDYSAAVNQLNNKLGGRLEGSKEYADLQRRRSMFRG
jgi:hypothetical protein